MSTPQPEPRVQIRDDHDLFFLAYRVTQSIAKQAAMGCVGLQRRFLVEQFALRLGYRAHPERIRPSKGEHWKRARRSSRKAVRR